MLCCGLQANLQYQLKQKCSEVQALQEQNMQLQAQMTALQQQLACSGTTGRMPQVQGLQDQVASQHTA